MLSNVVTAVGSASETSSSLASTSPPPPSSVPGAPEPPQPPPIALPSTPSTPSTPRSRPLRMPHPTASFAAIGALQRRDVELLHREQRVDDPLGLHRIGIVHQLDRDRRHDLPRQPVAIDQPAALGLAPALGEEAVPQRVDLDLRVARHVERDRRRELVVRPAVERDEPLPLDLEAGRHRGHRRDLRDREDRAVEGRGLVGVGLEPEERGDFVLHARTSEPTTGPRHPMRSFFLAMIPLACGGGGDEAGLGLERAVRTADVTGCTYASPVVAGDRVVIATTDGVVAAYGVDGAPRWQTTLPSPAGYRAWIGATPAVVEDHRVVVAWQDAVIDGEDRVAHHVAVLDAATGALDPAFPITTLAATAPAHDGATVEFLASNNFSRSALVHARRAGDELGVVYVGFGNLRDIQPWHGWVFELDLDAWRAGGAAAAISAVRLTTPEADCGPPGESGADDMLCGGGVWAPSGPTLVPRGDDYELWIATGNGLLDLAHGQLANTVIRTGRGLGVDPACDAAACADFDPIAPAEACMASCRDLFMPRLAPGDPPLTPPLGRCDGLGFLECYAELDLDLGASTPAVVTTPAGREVGVLPAKDGAVYLFDAAQLGAMLHRLPLRAFCGE